VTLLFSLLMGGLGNLASYLAAHVLLCLVPAFYIAGAMTALIPKPAVTRFLGRSTPKGLSYPAAALAGSLLAVCSCTIVPLFAGIYRKGAGIGPALTFLFFAPAANILALIYTGGVIGVDLALARLVLGLAFGIGIGLLMAALFRDADIAHDAATDSLFAGEPHLAGAAALLFVVLIALLLVGTLKLDALATPIAQVTVGVPFVGRVDTALHQLVPFDATKGEEGLTSQGAALILLLLITGLASWRGLEHIHQGFSRWTGVASALVVLTLVFAAVQVVTHANSLDLIITPRTTGVAAALAATILIAWRWLPRALLRDWLWESWRFVKQIFPLLIAGVFAVGILRMLIQPEWIETLAGTNSLLGNIAGVLFGVFMYFPTLVEVPIAKMLLGLGMHRGPLLAYLMADPELSLQSILMITPILGRLRTWTYVGWVALFSALAGLVYGAWVDGARLAMIALYITGFVALLACGFAALERHRRAMRARNPLPTPSTVREA